MNFRQRVSVCTVKQRRQQYLEPHRAHVYLQADSWAANKGKKTSVPSAAREAAFGRRAVACLPSALRMKGRPAVRARLPLHVSRGAATNSRRVEAAHGAELAGRVGHGRPSCGCEVVDVTLWSILDARLHSTARHSTAQ